MADRLWTFGRPPDDLDRARVIEDPEWIPPYAEPVLRADGRHVSVAALDDLVAEAEERRRSGAWAADRTECDRWLAPRVHWALRLTRAQAADPLMWLWVALRHSDHVVWRWSGEKGVIEDRWAGPVHKQAFSRLWWGGELFRDGPDYSPVVRAFVRQDLPNSYLHRPMVRCRPLALALLDVAAPSGREAEVSADEVNDLARAVNLGTAGAPPETEIGYVDDGIEEYLAWVRNDVPGPVDREAAPVGPPCPRVPGDALERAAAIAQRCAGWSRSAAEAKGARSARRRAARTEDGPEDGARPQVSARTYDGPAGASTRRGATEGPHG